MKRSLGIALLVAAAAATSPSYAEPSVYAEPYVGGNTFGVVCGHDFGDGVHAPGIGGACSQIIGYRTLDVIVTDASGSPVDVQVGFDTDGDGFFDIAHFGCGEVLDIPVPEGLTDDHAWVTVGWEQIGDVNLNPDGNENTAPCAAIVDGVAQATVATTGEVRFERYL